MRVLLSLYLNGRLNIEAAIEEDLKDVENRKVMRRI
jgi:hypothetical protein